jgi:hypothetical protein
MQRAVGRHAAQGLCRHGALHGMEGLRRIRKLEHGVGLGLVVSADRTIGIAEVPSQRIEVAENMAARAGGLAIA